MPSIAPDHRSQFERRREQLLNLALVGELCEFLSQCRKRRQLGKMERLCQRGTGEMLLLNPASGGGNPPMHLQSSERHGDFSLYCLG